jgi:DNA processing protein
VDDRTETASLVALFRAGRKTTSTWADAVTAAGGARALLDAEHGLLAESVLADARGEIAGWESRGIHVLSAADPAYPQNVRSDPSRPALLFVAGRLREADRPAVAVIGTRQPSATGRQMARAVSQKLVADDYTVLSGLAAGIDTEAHQAALDDGGRTVAVIGTGLDRFYPRENAPLQRRIAREGAVISQFWPEAHPARSNFPLRNALMAGLAEASVIVEATAMSGTRILARAAISLRRVVVLLETLMEQQWAQDLAQQPGVQVASSLAEVTTALERSLTPPPEPPRAPTALV